MKLRFNYNGVNTPSTNHVPHWYERSKVVNPPTNGATKSTPIYSPEQCDKTSHKKRWKSPPGLTWQRARNENYPRKSGTKNAHARGKWWLDTFRKLAQKSTTRDHRLWFKENCQRDKSYSPRNSVDKDSFIRIFLDNKSLPRGTDVRWGYTNQGIP